jgi:hypothetical protein
MTTLCNVTLTKAITTRINMKSAHKLAKLAMMAQANDNSGDLIYSDFLKYYLLNPIVKATPVAPAVAAKAVNIKDTLIYSFVAVVMILVGMLPNINLVNTLIENGYLSSNLKMVGLVGLSVMFNLLIVGIVKGGDMLTNNNREVA